jgi:hypothetical protein
VKVLRDASGNYLKTVCLVLGPAKYDAAVAFCAANGMKIANIDSPAVDVAIRAHGDQVYPTRYIWVEGKTSATSCSLLFRASVLTTFARATSDCSNSLNYYCEFDGMILVLGNTEKLCSLI